MPQNKRKEDVAAYFEVNPRTVLNWARDGCPCSRTDDRSPWMFDLAEVSVWLEKQDRTTNPGRPATGGIIQEGLRKAQLRLTLETGLIRKLQREKLDGTLHDVAECRERRLQQIYAVKHELYAMARHLPEDLVDQPKQIIQLRLTKEIERICNHFAKGVNVESNNRSLDTGAL